MPKHTPVNLVIVGHVDHGKSTLIGRLLFETDSLSSDRIAELERVSAESGKEIDFAYLLDHLEEERQQGITIDTTQVFFNTAKRRYVIIDAPGHVEFVKNMITGATQADAAVLLVDAREGVKEQTKRHANILSLIGIHQIIVVLNKMDLVNFSEERFTELRHTIGEFFSSVGMEPLLHVPVCATRGDNLARKSQNTPWYGGPTLLDGLDALSDGGSACSGPLILPIQDVYQVDGKRIAVGRLEAGTLYEGEQITVLQGGWKTGVRSIERYPESIDTAVAGQSVGITTSEPVDLKRGDVVCTPGGESILTDRFRANIIWMSEQQLNRDQLLRMRCATQDTECRIISIARRIDSSSLELIGERADILENLEVGEVLIKTREPIAVKPFNQLPALGRFVVLKEDDVCAGGIIPIEYREDRQG